MSQVLDKVRNVDPNNSEAVKDALTGFFQNLPKFTECNSHQWLIVLQDIINRFPKYCMTHRNTIETHLAHFLDSSNYYLVIEAAKCGLALQQVRPSQEKTATPKSCWREQTSLLSVAAHSLIAVIFPNIADVYNTSEQIQENSLCTTPLSIALSQITEISKTNGRTKDYDVQDRQNLLCLRLKNVLVFLQAMLVEVYPVAKPVRAQTVLDVAVRALTASAASAAPAQLTLIKIEALRTLDALVMCLGANLIPFSPLVFRIAMQTLRWSSEQTNKEFSNVRVQAYSTLSGWLSTLRCHQPGGGGGGRRGRTLEDELTTFLLGDITPQRHVVQLTMSSQPTKNMSKKAKRKLANASLRDSGLAAHMPGANKLSGPVEFDEDVSIVALECLEMFLTVCGIFLKPNTHKLIQERVLRECYNWPSYTAPRVLCLLRCIEASRRAGGRAPPPAPRAMQIYSTLVNAPDREISKFCSQALLEMRLQLHCSPPTISYALDAPTETETPQEKTKGISERNRAALEQLLGADKLPSSATEEIITIADEPSSKKARLSQDAETENISVSSQSDVEISDDEEDDDIEVQVVQENGTEEVAEPIDIEEPEVTEVLKENIAESVTVAKVSIHELSTQIHANLSNDTTDGHDSPTPNSLEVDYDYPNTGNSKIAVLEKIEADNLPSTNETDDIQITCGQMIKSSQEVHSQKKIDEAVEVPKVNGIDEKIKMNGFGSNENVTETVTVKIASTDADGVTVEDMLADFVDEVNDEVVEV